MTHEEFVSKYHSGDGYWVCPVCGIEVYRSISNRHFKEVHKLDTEGIYRRFVEVDDKCICGKSKSFRNMNSGYTATCGDKECVSTLQSKLMSSLNRAWWSDPVYRERTCAFLKSVRDSDNFKIAVSGPKEWMNDPDKYNEWLANLRKSHNTEEYRSGCSDRAANQWRDDYHMRDVSSLVSLSTGMSLYGEEDSIYVYILVSDDSFKVGVSLNPELRCNGRKIHSIKSLNPSVAFKLEFIIKMSSPINRRFDNRGKGWTEWRDMEYMDEALSLFNLEEDAILEMANTILGE